MALTSHDSNTGGGGSNHSGEGQGLEPSPEKPVTTPRTPTERKRKRKANTSGPTLIGPGGGAGSGDRGSGAQLSDIITGSEAQKSSNKPINEYFPKRAPSSPVRGGTKSPLSFGSMYPQSPKTSYVSSPSGNANNGPMSYNQSDYYQQHSQGNYDNNVIIQWWPIEMIRQKRLLLCNTNH